MAQKITVVNTTTQATQSWMSDAKTLGELKSEMSSRGISYDGMTFFESTNGVELANDSSVVPTAATAKGLAFMLTKPNKHISSGAFDRKELYAKVKSLGIAEDIKKKYGKNFTMCSSADLDAAVKAAEKKAGKNTPKTTKEAPKAEPKAEPKPAPAPKEEPKKPASKSCECNSNLEEAVKFLAEKAGYAAQVNAILNGEEVPEDEDFSADELKKMQAAAVARMKK